MADKSQKKSNKEIRKPKKDKGKTKGVAAAPATVISAVSQKEKK